MAIHALVFTVLLFFLDWIYTTGGYTGIGRSARSSGERYSCLHDRWHPIKDMNKPRFGHAVISLNGKIKTVLLCTVAKTVNFDLTLVCIIILPESQQFLKILLNFFKNLDKRRTLQVLPGIFFISNKYQSNKLMYSYRPSFFYRETILILKLFLTFFWPVQNCSNCS